MRTTIELSDPHRAALLDLAARRRHKGFSDLISEAIDLFLERQAQTDARLDRALRAQGALLDEEAAELRAGVQEVRRLWRAEATPSQSPNEVRP